MPLYKWNEVREKKGRTEAVHKQREFVPVPHQAVSTGTTGMTSSKETDSAVFDRMRQQVQQEAESVLNDARSEAEALRRQGYEEGKKAAQAELQEQYKNSLKKVFDATKEAVEQRDKIIRSAEPEILKLATKIAMQLIHSEITLNRDVIMNVVSDAINKITDKEQVIIKVNQADLERVKDHKEDIEDMLDGAKNLSIVPDKKVEAGGCIIETKVGLVDARVSTKVEAIEKAFMKVYTEDLKKEAVSKGVKADERTISQLRGEIPAEIEEEAKPEESSPAESGEDNGTEPVAEEKNAESEEAKKDEGDFDFDTDDLDLDLDFGEDVK
jgi:flagellar assembly protein FliH